MATIKKAQAGTRIDKTSTKKVNRKPDVVAEKSNYSFLKSSEKGKNPTKKDSTNYDRGYNVGKKDKKSLFMASDMNAYMGSVEGAMSKKPKKKLQTGGNLGKIYTGSAKTNPGVLKAKADKAKATSNIKNVQSKAKLTFSKAVKAVKKKN
jgi:hypothetical protein